MYIYRNIMEPAGAHISVYPNQKITTLFRTHRSSQGCFSWLGPSAPIFSTIFLLLGLLAQFLGSFCLLCLKKITFATNALITWVIVQPILYGQLSNFEFVAESLSLVGGLLLLKAHLVKGTGNEYEEENETNERTKVRKGFVKGVNKTQ